MKFLQRMGCGIFIWIGIISIGITGYSIWFCVKMVSSAFE